MWRRAIRGYSYVAENKTDSLLLARTTATTFRDSIGTAYRVVELPARSRLVFAVEPFAGDHIGVIDILTTDCALLGSVSSFTTMGALIVINPGPTIEQRKEWPQGALTAVSTDSCLPPPALTTGSPNP